MIEEGEFIMDLTVQVSSEMAETEILMVIRENQLKQNLFPISGFPRRLQDDYESKPTYAYISTPAVQCNIANYLSLQSLLPKSLPAESD